MFSFISPPNLVRIFQLMFCNLLFFLMARPFLSLINGLPVHVDELHSSQGDKLFSQLGIAGDKLFMLGMVQIRRFTSAAGRNFSVVLLAFIYAELTKLAHNLPIKVFGNQNFVEIHVL